jgi:hypothetical protein
MPLASVFTPPTMELLVATPQAVVMAYFSESGFVPSSKEGRNMKLNGVSQPVVPTATPKEQSVTSIVPTYSVKQVVQLKEQGFVAMKLTVPPLFSQRGKLYSQLELPRPFKVLSVVREGEVLPTSLEAQFIKTGDDVFILSQQPEAVRSQFFSTASNN